MRVYLVQYPPNYLDILYFTARTCYSEKSIIELRKEVEFTPREEKLKLIKHLYRAGHHSIFEHVTITVAIENISRVCSHQLVRHRLCSFAQRSQRYTKQNNRISHKQVDHEVPMVVDQKFEFVWNLCYKQYQELIEQHHVKPEIARYVLPQMCDTTIVVTANLRQWLHMFNLRLCMRAQYEIRELMWNTFELFVEYMPDLFKDRTFWVVDCVNGKCKQGKQSCGKSSLVLQRFERVTNVP